MSQPLSCEKCGTVTYLRDGYECPECYSPEKRAERERGEARAKVERLEKTVTALREALAEWMRGGACTSVGHDYAKTHTRSLFRKLRKERAALGDK